MNDLIKQSESDVNNSMFLKQWSAVKGPNRELLDHINFFVKSQMKLAYKKGVEDVKKYLQVQCLDYCEQQNGLDHCKNCGLSIELIDEWIALQDK